LPLLSNFASVYVIRKVLENKWKPKLNQTHQLLTYADDVDLLGDNADTTKKIQKLHLMVVGRLVLKRTQRKLNSICCCLVTRLQAKIMA
jgi:hypothetical protein